MAHTKTTDWKKVWYFPWAESREVGLFSDVMTDLPMDVSSFWTEYRWSTSNKDE